VEGSPQGITESFAAQVSVLSELISACLEAELQPEGVGLSTFELLSAIHASAEPPTQAEVARRLGIAAASLSEAVKSASARGLVVQEDSPGDRRAKRLRLSPKGRKIVDVVLHRLNQLEESMLRGMARERVAGAAEVLRHATRELARSLPES
jgi:DNA-binding MarR family transcriptional regulator